MEDNLTLFPFLVKNWIEKLSQLEMREKRSQASNQSLTCSTFFFYFSEDQNHHFFKRRESILFRSETPGSGVAWQKQFFLGLVRISCYRYFLGVYKFSKTIN